MRGKLTEEQRDRIRELHSEGVTLRDIAIEFGVSHTAIRYHVNDDYRAEDIQRRSQDQKQNKDAVNARNRATYRRNPVPRLATNMAYYWRTRAKCDDKANATA